MRLTASNAQIALVAFASLLYSNTLFSGFTFDDNFAVVRCCKSREEVACDFLLGLSLLSCADMQIHNRDVTDSIQKLSELFKNDFW